MAAVLAAVLGVDPLLTLAALGVLAGMAQVGTARRRTCSAGSLGATGAVTAASAVPVGLALLFLVMLKIGATIFGGG